MSSAWHIGRRGLIIKPHHQISIQYRSPVCHSHLRLFFTAVGTPAAGSGAELPVAVPTAVGAAAREEQLLGALGSAEQQVGGRELAGPG